MRSDHLTTTGVTAPAGISGYMDGTTNIVNIKTASYLAFLQVSYAPVSQLKACYFRLTEGAAAWKPFFSRETDFKVTFRTPETLSAGTGGRPDASDQWLKFSIKSL